VTDENPTFEFEGENTFTLEIPKGAKIASARAEITGSEAAFEEDAADISHGIEIAPSAQDSDGNWLGASQTWLVVKFPARWFVSGIKINLTSSCYISLKFWAGVTWYQPEPTKDFIFDSPQGEIWPFPKVETDRVLLSLQNALDDESPPDTSAEDTSVTELCLYCSSLPSNLSLKVSDQSPFWTRLEPLGKVISIPDFSRQLNEYLDNHQLSVNEISHRVPVTIHSDTWGKVELNFDLDYFFVIEHFLDNNEEKTLSFSCTGSWVQEVRFEFPPHTSVRKATFELADTFGEDRFLDGYGPSFYEDNYLAVTVSADYLPAQQFVLGQDINVAGIDLYLERVSDTARFSVQLRPDSEGVPSEEVLYSQEVSLDKDSGKGAHWVCVDLPEPSPLPQACYWLVLKAEEGEACWYVSTENSELAPLNYMKNGGEKWEIYKLTPLDYIKNDVKKREIYELASTMPGPDLSGIFRLRHIPASYHLPVSMNLLEGSGIVLDAFVNLEKLTGSLDFTDALQELTPAESNTRIITLQVQGKAAGDLTISKLQVEYVYKEEEAEPEEEVPPEEEPVGEVTPPVIKGPTPSLKVEVSPPSIKKVTPRVIKEAASPVERPVSTLPLAVAAEKDIIEQTPYIANSNTLEIHKSTCYWVKYILASNKVPVQNLKKVAEFILNQGYNGCHFCLPRYDTDTLTRSQVINNLNEDLS
jgi:hypothetical protein